MRARYAPDPKWHETEELRELKLSYLDQIETAAEEHQSRVTICNCFSCGIAFLSSRSNRDRVDLRCPFGCRERHQKRSTRARSLRHYQTEKGRQRKFILNRRRSKNSQEEITSSVVESKSRDFRLQYYTWLIGAITGLQREKLCVQELLLVVLEKLRQRGLEVKSEIDYIRDD